MSDRIDFEQVREVIRIAEESGLASLEVETPTLTVRVSRTAAPVVATQPVAASAAGAASTERAVPAPALSAGAQAGSQNHLEPLIAPMVGTFYRAPSPEGPPFVKEGDYVDEGQVVCVIEAMKLFNEIQAEKAGRLARVLVDNATPVEYGQPLFLLDSAAPRA
jgi:acetyl-CoA carboxylase biotin carboxyl carrier protein